MSDIYTNGLPTLTTILGTESIPVGSGLGSGANPQTALVSVAQLAQGAVAGTAIATSNAATQNAQKGAVTSEALSTASGADYLLTLTNSKIAATSVVLVSVGNGTNTTEGIAVNRVNPAAGSCVIHIRNTHASAALNGTIVIAYAVM